MATTVAAHGAHSAATRVRVERRPVRGRAGSAAHSGIATAAVACVVFLLFLLLTGLLPTPTDRVPDRSATRAIRVSSSQTLWSIARDNRMPGASVADTVRIIRALNGLHRSQLALGSVILVPAPETLNLAHASR